MPFNKKQYLICLMMAVLLILSACGVSKPEQPTDGLPPFKMEGTITEVPPEETPTPEEPVTPAEQEPIQILAPEDIQKELYDSICEIRQPAVMDISTVALSEYPEIDVKNLYYGIMEQYPELKYAYDITAVVENGILTCKTAFMPYKTGDWPETVADAREIASLGELLREAEAHIGTEPYPIRLTDTSLAPDDMNRILQQAGGGYILCALNQDATAITYTPTMGMEIDECLSLLAQADELAEQVVAQEVHDGMTEREKAEALYAYLTSHVKYDQRYYSDPQNMPFDSQTAIGALRDGTAICGGYSHALKLLFEKAGISCYNVTGRYFRENHMWDIAFVNGEWLWFDATSDRGVSQQFGFRHFALQELDTTQYTWESSNVELLIQAENEKQNVR